MGIIEATSSSERPVPGTHRGINTGGGWRAAQGARALVLSGSPGIFSAGLDVPCLLKLDRPSMNAVWRNFYGLMRALAWRPIQPYLSNGSVLYGKNHLSPPRETRPSSLCTFLKS